MSLNKGIKSGKERRNPYRGAKSVDRSCRNHGDCPWCEGSRLRWKKILTQKEKDEHENTD